MKKLFYKITILSIISLATLSSCKTTFKCNEMLKLNKVKDLELSQNTNSQPPMNIGLNTLVKEDMLIDNNGSSVEALKNSYSLKSNSRIGNKSAVKNIFKNTFKKKYLYKAFQTAIYKKTGNHARTADDHRKVEGLGLAGFIIGIVGWFMPIGLGLVMCLLALIFGAISLGKIKNNPEKFKGKGLAITSLILGIAGIGIILLIAL